MSTPPRLVLRGLLPAALAAALFGAAPARAADEIAAGTLTNSPPMISTRATARRCRG